MLLSREPRQETLVAPRGRMPILAAATVLVVLGIGAAAMNFAAREETGAGDTSAVTQDTGAVPAASGTAVADGSAPEAATPGGAGVPDSRDATPAATVRPMGEAVTPPSSGKSAGSTDVNAELADILETIADARSASRAVARIDALAAAGRLPRGSEEHLWSQYARAQAYLFMDREADGCAILAGLKGRSARPVRNDAIDATFSAASCQ